MLHFDVPTLAELKALSQERDDACVSLCVPIPGNPPDSDAARIAYGNACKEALEQLERAGRDKRRVRALEEQLGDLESEDDFWRFQARSLVVLATPDALRSFRLPNRLTAGVEVSDRYHLKPLLRALTFPHEAFVLALSENAVRLVELSADLPASAVDLPTMPQGAAAATGRASVNKRSPRGRLQGSEGQKVLLRQYARRVDAELRGVLSGRDAPLLLAATEPLASIYRSVNTHPSLLATGIVESPDRRKDAELAAAARPLLDAHYAAELASLRDLYARRAEQKRTTSDVAIAARAATQGAIEVLWVDIDASLPGGLDESGILSLEEAPSAESYSVLDEIARRALLSGARVLGVRKDEIPGGTSVAAILRYAEVW